MTICLPFAPSLVRQLNTAGPSAIAWTVYLGAFPTALAFTTWAFALARTNAGRLAAMTYLVPPLSVVLGWALLGETPPLLALAGGALCLTGVVVSRRRPPLRRRLRPDEQPVRAGDGHCSRAPGIDRVEDGRG